MNQKTFLFALIHFYSILFSLLTTITFSSVDPSFEACEPKTCGNGQNISYPFYIIGKQEPFCAYPGFELTCAENGFPILNTQSNNQYIVQEIFYNNQSLRVSIPMFSQPSTSVCIPRIRDFSNYSRRFSVAPKQKDVLLLYGCDLSSLPEEMKDHRIGCYAENKTRSVVALYREDPNLGLALRNCKTGVANTTVEDERGGIQDALKRGFLLSWTATNCDECMKSGGRCGFDQNPDTYAFRCYCRDGVINPAKCDPQPLSG